jgi:hypothetical protein
MKLLFAENPISVKLSYPIIINVYSDSYTTHRVFNLSRWNVFLDFDTDMSVREFRGSVNSLVSHSGYHVLF